MWIAVLIAISEAALSLWHARARDQTVKGAHDGRWDGQHRLPHCLLDVGEMRACRDGLNPRNALNAWMMGIELVEDQLSHSLGTEDEHATSF